VHQKWTYEHWWLISAFALQSQITVGGDCKADILIKDIKRWINAKDTELVWVGAELADLLQLSVIGQNKKQVWVNGAFANKDCIFGRFFFSFGTL